MPCLDDGIDRAGFFAETAEDALEEIDVIPGRTARSIITRLGLDRTSARLGAQIIVWVGSRSTGADMRWRHRVLRETLAIVKAAL